MAVVTRNTLKGWFVTMAKPVQSQFWDWIDSFRHKSEKITSDDLDPALLDIINSLPPGSTIDQLFAELANKADLENGILKESQWPPAIFPTTVVTSSDQMYTLPSGKMLDKVVIIPTADSNIGIGYSVGVDDIMPTMPLLAGRAEVITLSIYAIGDTPIYFTGIVASTTIKFYTR